MTELEIIAIVIVGILGVIGRHFIVNRNQDQDQEQEDKETISKLQAQVHTLYTQIRWVRDVDKARCAGKPCRRAADKIFENISSK